MTKKPPKITYTKEQALRDIEAIRERRFQDIKLPLRMIRNNHARELHSAYKAKPILTEAVKEKNNIRAKEYYWKKKKELEEKR